MTTTFKGIEIVTEGGVHSIGDRVFASMVEAMNYAESISNVE